MPESAEPKRNCRTLCDNIPVLEMSKWRKELSGNSPHIFVDGCMGDIDRYNDNYMYKLYTCYSLCV
jgi:hypothetical protein